MRIDILTLFPEICRAPLSESMMKRAQANGALELHIHNLRDWTTDKHHIVDDAPFGGGQGMVMKPEPIFAAVEDLKSDAKPAWHLEDTAGQDGSRRDVAAEFFAETDILILSSAGIMKGSTTASPNIWPMPKFRLAITS